MAPGPQLAVLLCVLAIGSSINRPVVKIVLNQKGYAQFIQYDVETPPLREFTLCAWVRLQDLAGDQSIFTYVGSGSSRIIRVWLKRGGRQLWVSIDARAAAGAAVEFDANTWRHVCLSYQSDFGAWALYIDSRLIFCQTSQKLLGFIVPGGGSLIIGYGISEKDGVPNGLEGEIYGASMILLSTIERNYTLKLDPRYKQKTLRKNRIRGKTNQDDRYIVLGDLQTDEIRASLHGTPIPVNFNKTRNFIRFTTPHSFIDHDIGIELISANPKVPSSSEKEILDMSDTGHLKSNKNSGITFWNQINQNLITKSRHNESKIELTGSGTRDLITVFDYETPPSVTAPKEDYSSKGLDLQGMVKHNNKMYNEFTAAISDVEKPPLPEEKAHVYGQWTNTKFVGNVLKYLKSINFNKNGELKKVPPTIPLVKLSDSFPYASEFIHTKLRPPIKFNRKQFSKKRHVLKKRDLKRPQINLQVIETDIRSEILKSHSETQPKLVELTNRGEAKFNEDKRYYRNAESYAQSLELTKTSQSPSHLFKGHPFSLVQSTSNKKIMTNLERHRSNNVMTILPFLKSVEYFMDESNRDTKATDNNLMYSKSFANANMWHNVKSYSNDYTPRRIDLDGDRKSGIELKIAEVNKRNPSIQYKYTHDGNKLVPMRNDATIEKGRALAEEVSNQANENKDSISILKYNHGFLSSNENRTKTSEKINNHSMTESRPKKNKNNFNKHVKLGNALNEQQIIGKYEEQNKQSFIGGNDDVPDINRYRSGWDNQIENIPPSLGPKVCKNVELYDRVMYVQPDGSIDMTHILSPVRQKNLGIEFITQNYKKCSMHDSTLENSPYLLIDWIKTPVKLFGGAYPKRTKDLCGFF